MLSSNQPSRLPVTAIMLRTMTSSRPNAPNVTGQLVTWRGRASSVRPGIASPPFGSATTALSGSVVIAVCGGAAEAGWTSYPPL